MLILHDLLLFFHFEIVSLAVWGHRNIKIVRPSVPPSANINPSSLSMDPHFIAAISNLLVVISPSKALPNVYLLSGSHLYWYNHICESLVGWTSNWSNFNVSPEEHRTTLRISLLWFCHSRMVSRNILMTYTPNPIELRTDFLTEEEHVDHTYRACQYPLKFCLCHMKQ